MPSVEASEIAAQAAALRAELKDWERGFAAANGGKKAGRGDIKKVPEIAAKYKEYSRLKADETRAFKDSKPQPKSSDHEDQTKSKKRKHSSPTGPEPPLQNQTTSTPRKSSHGLFQTPSKAKPSHPSNVDPYDSPSVLRRLFSPSTHATSSPLKTAIGPTPQRDGKALGLFDLLSESGGSTATPSATRIASIKGMDAQTPSKKRKAMDTIAEEDEEEEDTLRGERTPASSSKKYMLSALFATPTAWRYSAIVEDDTTRNLGNSHLIKSPSQPTPTSKNPNLDPSNLETPSFLRRSTSGLYNSQNGTSQTGLSPIPVRKPPVFVGKGLSQLVQGLRDMEEENADDDLDVLREIEAEQNAQEVNVPDSQIATDANGRVYKKKGQKRTTRMVKMRPVVVPSMAVKLRPKSDAHARLLQRGLGAIHVGDRKDDNDETGSVPDEDELQAIAETQAQADVHSHSHDEADLDPFDNGDMDSLHSISEPESEYEADSDADYDPGSRSLGRTKSFTEKMREAIGSTKAESRVKAEQARARDAEKKAKEKEKEKDEEREKKASTRKVNPQAHANYRSLKIRNRGGKAGGRGFGRFRRR
ncbi:DNA replication/checkpoint protein [Aspergillus karnatakaensis]|uniref:protein sld2 n=1 Tax=Aspergillus karnatakaensis TaxID=1810916 RepID=UPI003CCCB672